MNKSKLAFLAFILLTAPMASFCQAPERGPMVIRGMVVDKDHAPIPYVSVFNRSQYAAAIANRSGEYQVVAYAGDTISFSAVSYRKTSFIVPYDLNESVYQLSVVMELDTVNLKEVVIYPWPATYEDFKKDFMNTEVKDPIANLDLGLPSAGEMKALASTPQTPGSVTYTMTGPISLLYNTFSKEARMRRNFDDVLLREKADARYNKEIVSRITGLENEEKIAEFMRFCPLDARFILRSSDYELYLAIRNCYLEYASLEMPADTVIQK